MSSPTCPFRVGQLVRFTPSERTRGQYQSIESFGIEPDAEQPIAEIREGVYLYFAGGSGGWSWSEFTSAE